MNLDGAPSAVSDVAVSATERTSATLDSVLNSSIASARRGLGIGDAK
jgi:hypothetical protein